MMIGKSSLPEVRKVTSRLSHIKREGREREGTFGERFLSDQDFWARRELLDLEVKGYH